MDYFYENLPRAFAEAERIFNQFREGFVDKELLVELTSRGNTPVVVPNGYQPQKPFWDLGLIRSNSRIAINLNNGYVMKVRPCQGDNFYYTPFRFIQNRNQDNMEEDNVRTLRKYGFTTENGYLVPEHKVVGIHLDNDVIKVDTNGFGVTITEDLSDVGNCDVVEFEPQLLTTLQNGETLSANYQRHIQALFDLYNNPKIIATINRHAEPWDIKSSIDKMLLVVIKEDKGKLAIADLDNLIFDEVAEN